MKIKSLVPCFIILLSALLLLHGCSSGVNQNTMEDCAKTFVQGMIDSDEKKLDAINRSEKLDRPTSNLLKMANNFSKYKLSDFSFATNESKKTVDIKSSDGKIKYTLTFIKANDKYYFYTLKQ